MNWNIWKNRPEERWALRLVLIFVLGIVPSSRCRSLHTCFSLSRTKGGGARMASCASGLARSSFSPSAFRRPASAR